MKKVSKVFAILLSVCLLFSLAAISAGAAATQIPNDNYARPTVTANKITTRPNIDGKLNDATWSQATKFEFSKDSLTGGDGLLYSYQDSSGEWTELPEDGDGYAYIGWDAEYVYFALQIQDEEHVNNQSRGSDLWRGDCLQLQIGHSQAAMLEDEARFELGFAMNSVNGRQLGFRWDSYTTGDPLSAGGSVNMAAGAGADYYYFVGRDDDKYTTTYEIAIQHDWLGGDGLAANDRFLFSFALHLDADQIPDSCNDDPSRFEGYFMEWAQGEVGGKSLMDAGIITCVEGSSGDNVPTTKPPVTPTTTTTPPPETPTTTTTNNVPGTPTTTTPPPETPTTTTTTAAVEDDTAFTVNDAVVTDSVDESIMALAKALHEGKEIKMLKVEAPEGKDKLHSYVNDKLLGAYVLDDGELVEAEITQVEGEDGDVDAYVVEDGVLYFVIEEEPTTLPPETTTTTTTTTKASETTTTTAAAADADAEEGGFPLWIIIAIAAVVVAAVVVVVIVLKKKGAAPTDAE